MADNHRCPECQAVLPIDAPDGLCAACLMRAGFAEEGAPTEAMPAGSFTPPDPSELAHHFPQLEIHQLLGHGGMGAVYRARQKALDRIVALKIMPPQSANDPAFAERFAREARAMARLHHSNIVTVFEFGEKDGLFYLIMEYVDGVNLRQAIRSKQITGEQALSIVPQICDALQYAHEEGVVHRDIKPENILLDKRGRVKIADFGLAKLLRKAPVDVTLTSMRQVVGTLHYMAPEQIEHPLQVDHRADIYSLGVVFYELLTGDLPVGRFKLPSERAAIDVRLDDVVLKTLEREPDARYQSASDLKTDVQTISSTAPPIMRQPVAAPSPQLSAELPDGSWTLDTSGPGMVLMVLGILGLVSGVLATVFGFAGVAQVPALNILGFLGIPGLVAHALMIVGGVCLQRRRSYGWAMAGSIAALLPLSAAWIFTAPAGIWALMALRRAMPQTSHPATWQRAPQAKYTDEDLAHARGLTTAPGVLLAVVGFLDLIMVALVIGYFLLQAPANAPEITSRVHEHPAAVAAPEDILPVQEHPTDVTADSSRVHEHPAAVAERPTWILSSVFVFGFFQVPIGLLLVIGGMSMWRLQSRTMGILASLAAMLPLHAGCLLGFPVGIWALVTLLRHDVMTAFRFRRSKAPNSSSQMDYATPSDIYRAPSSSAGIVKWIVILIIFLVLSALAVAALVVGVFWLTPM